MRSSCIFNAFQYGKHVTDGESIELNASPVYICGLSNTEMYKAAANRAHIALNKALEKVKNFSCTTEVQSLMCYDLKSVDDWLTKIGENSVNSDEAKTYLNVLFETGNSCIKYYTDKMINDDIKKISSFLAAISQAQDAIACLYEATLPKSETITATSAAEREIELTKEYLNKLGDKASEEAKAILKKATDYLSVAEKVENLGAVTMKNGMFAANDYMAAKLAVWARNLTAVDIAEQNDIYIEGKFSKDGRLTISGMVGKIGDEVTILVLKPSANGNISSGEIDFVWQLKSDDKRSFSIDYLTAGTEGVYTIYALSDSWKDKKIISVSNYTDDTLNNIAAKLKNSADKIEFEKIFNENAKLLKVQSVALKSVLDNNWRTELGYCMNKKLLWITAAY